MGPLGAALNPGVTGVAETGHHANASTFCGRCAEVCPVMIPLPKIMRHWRAVEHAQGLAPKSLTFGLALWAFAAKRPRLYRLGASALALPSRPSLALAAALYSALAWFAVRLLRLPAAVESCGCFGGDAPPSRVHAVYDAGAALLMALAALSPPPGVAELAARAPVAGIGLVVACATAAYAMTLVLGRLPAAVAAYRPRGGAA